LASLLQEFSFHVKNVQRRSGRGRDPRGPGPTQERTLVQDSGDRRAGHGQDVVHQALRAPGVDVRITIFGDLCQFSAKKMAFFSLTNVMIKCLQKVFGEKFGVFLINQCYDQIFSKSSSSLSKKRQYFHKKFGENIF
jgi:hypothetical protein